MASKNKEPDVKFDPEMEISEQIRKLLEKKVRNLEKRKQRLEEYMKKKEKGEKLAPEQEDALKNYLGVVETAQTLHSIIKNVSQLFNQQSRWLKKEKKNQKKSTGKVTPVQEEASTVTSVIEREPVSASPEPEKKPDELPSQLKECLEFQSNIYRLLQCFGEDSVRNAFLEPRGQAGVTRIEQVDLDYLDEIHDLLNPIASVSEAVDPLGSTARISTLEVNTHLGPAHNHWVSLFLHKDEPFLEDGTSYAKIAELCDKLVRCDFFQNWKPAKIVVTEAPIVQVPSAVVNETPELIQENAYPGNGYQSHTSAAPALNTGGVERMLQTLSTPYQFMQNPATPSPQVTDVNTRVAAVVNSPQNKVAEHLPPKEITNYWTTTSVPAGDNVAPPPGLTTGHTVVANATHDASDKLSKIKSVDWNSDNYSAPYESSPFQAPAEIVSVSQPNSRDVHRSTSPPANLSWADKVRHSAGGANVPPPLGSYPTVQQSQSGGQKAVSNVNTFVASAEPNFPPTIQSGGMDVFDTASHSQFISSHPEGGQGRRGGHRQGGAGRGGRGAGVSGGTGGGYNNRGASGTYRGSRGGSGRSNAGGNTFNVNGQRQGGRPVQNYNA